MTAAPSRRLRVVRPPSPCRVCRSAQRVQLQGVGPVHCLHCQWRVPILLVPWRHENPTTGDAP